MENSEWVSFANQGDQNSMFDTEIMTLDVDRLVAILREMNVTAGDFIAVYTINSPEMYVACLALSKLGAIAALINTNLRGEHPHYHSLSNK